MVNAVRGSKMTEFVFLNGEKSQGHMLIYNPSVEEVETGRSRGASWPASLIYDPLCLETQGVVSKNNI